MKALQTEKEAADPTLNNVYIVLGMDVIILFNMFQMGVCAGEEDVRMCPTMICEVFEHGFVAIFLLEFIIKFYIYRRAYFENQWHQLEAVLAVTAVLDAWILAPILSGRGSKVGHLILIVFYLIRILRFCRLLRTRPKLLMLFEGLTSSIKNITSVCLLLGMVIWGAAIFCVIAFAQVETQSDLNFSNLPMALFTLFTLSIVADWTEIVWPVVDAYWWSPLFFMSFTFVATFGILNLVIGVITERTIEVQQEYQKREQDVKEHEKMLQIKTIADVIFDEQDDDTITREEMMEYVNGDVHGPKIREFVVGADLPEGYDIWDCHAMFDRDVSGTITKEEFVQGMGRLIYSNDFQRSAMTQIAISDVMCGVKEVENKLIFEFDRLRRDLGLKPVDREAEAKEAEEAEAKKTEEAAPENKVEQVEQAPPELVPQPESLMPMGRSRETEVEEIPTALCKRDNLPSCKLLVERLQEPLTQLLADHLSTATLPLELPAPTLTITRLGQNETEFGCSAGGWFAGLRSLETRRGVGGQAHSRSSGGISGIGGISGASAGGTSGGSPRLADGAVAAVPAAVAPLGVAATARWQPSRVMESQQDVHIMEDTFAV